jgi:hypothetical protein
MLTIGHRAILFILAMGLLPAAVHTQPPPTPTPPIPPRLTVDTRFAPTTGGTIRVAAGGDLQAALEAAKPGDTIALEAGATFHGNFTLPKKTGTGWIVIRSSVPDTALPAPGVRATPSFASVMPRVVSPNSGPAIQTAAGAQHYRLLGLELTVADNVKTIYHIIGFGGDQRSTDDTPHNLIVDRCYIHGQPKVNVFRGLLLNSAFSAIVDSHVSEIHVAGFDSQAVLGFNGPGPFKIVNNYLEGAGENIMFGGADPSIPDLVPSDIEIRRNHIAKPLKWKHGDPSFAGIYWTIKNLFELKNARRVVVEGNLLENVWAQGQGGAAVLFTPRNQDGRAPWSVVEDVLFRNNVVRNATGGFVALSDDHIHPSLPVKRLAVVNNLWRDISATGFLLTRSSKPFEDIIVDHNTIIPTAYFSGHVEARGSAPAVIRLQVTNNVIGFGSYGTNFDGRDAAGMARSFPDSVIARNALVSLRDIGDGQGTNRNKPWFMNPAMYLSYGSAEKAGLNPDGALTADSPLKGGATDGKNIGADLIAISQAFKP